LFLAIRISIVPTPYPKEFRADVVAVARASDKSRAEIARSLGISESCLARWLQIADRDDGFEQSVDRADAAVEVVHQVRCQHEGIQADRRRGIAVGVGGGEREQLMDQWQAEEPSWSGPAASSAKTLGSSAMGARENAAVACRRSSGAKTSSATDSARR
jgi:transposase-like protein